MNALLRIGRHLRRVEMAAATATRLGLIHRRVGIAHQDINVLAIRRIKANADAGCYIEFMLDDLEGLREQLDQLIGQGADHGRILDILNDADELIPAQSRQGIADAQARLQPVRNRHQQFVADGVAERVIHFLEAVEVNEQHRQLQCFSRLEANAFLQLLGEHQPVGQASQRIMMRQVIKAQFGVAPFDNFGAQFRRAFLYAMVKLAIGGLQLVSLTAQNGLSTTHHQQLNQVQRAQHGQHDQPYQPLGLIKLAHIGGDILIDLEHTHQLALLTDRRVTGDHVNVYSVFLESVELVTVRQFADDISGGGSDKTGIAAFIFANLLEVGGIHRQAIEVIDLDLDRLGIPHQRGNFGMQPTLFHLLPQLVG